MTTTRRTASLTAGALLLALAACDDSILVERGCHTRALPAVDADGRGADLVRVRADVYELEVVGVRGSGRVRVSAEVCAPEDALQHGVELYARAANGAVEVVARVDRHSRDAVELRRLRVEVPDDLELDVDNADGDLEVTGVGPLTLRDGRGEARVSDVAGDVRAFDGGGRLEVDGVVGDVWVRDGDGSLRVTDVDGAVEVDAAGSGDSLVERIGGDVLIRDAGRDYTTVRDVDGGLRVLSGSRSRIRYSNVRGSVELP